MADPASPQDEVSPAPTKRRRWPRRLLLVGVILLLLVVAAPLALGLPFVRNLVAGKIGDALNREVTVGSAFAFWGKGIDLEDVVVKSPEGFDEPLATIQRVHVDVSLLALLGGGLDADVLVERPRIAFAKDAAGRSNADGLFGEAASADGGAPHDPRGEASGGDAEATADVNVRLEIVDGVVRASLPDAARVEELRDLDVVAALTPDGAVELALSALAVDAAAGGGDAPLRVDVSVSGTREGPVKIEVPAIDLSRLAGIVEGASGVTGLRGRFQLTVDAEARGADRMTGRVLAQADGLALTTPGGLRVAAQRIGATANVAEGEDGTTGRAAFKVEHLELLDESGEKPRRFREPLVELVLEGRHDPAEERIVVSSGRLTAGQAVSANTSQPWEIRTGASPSAKGELVVQADLQRLSNLRAFVPALESIQAGRIGARVVAEAEDGLDVRTGVRIRGLSLAASDLSPNGHVEQDVLIQLRVLQEAGAGDRPTRIVLTTLTSSIAKWSGAAGKPPLEISFAEAGVGAHGAGTLDVDLAALGSAFGGALGLERGERLGGMLRLVPEAALEPDEGTAKVALAGRNLTVPPSWARGVPPSSLDGQATLTLAGDRLDLDLSTLRGFGLDAKATARMNRNAESGGLEQAALRVTGDLARARPLLAPLLGLEGRAQVHGTLDAQADVLEKDGARRLTGRTTVTGLAWTDAQGQRLLEEPRLELTHDVSMSTGTDGRYGFEEVKVVSQALQARLEGAATTSEVGTNLEATLHLDGDANRLAGILRSAFGEEYRDLTGAGRIQGRVGLRGSTADGMRTLLVDGTLKPGTWSAGGLTLAQAGLTVKRAAESDPLRLAFQGGVNGGRMDLGFGVRLGTGPRSWTLDLRLERVDTSPLLVDHGAGEYLTWFLPTLVPSDKQNPVLSGLLDARIAMRAADLGERMEATLTGDGFVKMDQGSIGDSTLFRVIGGGRGLGNVGNLLVKAVPEVGDALAGLQRSMTFTKMESRFDVAHRVVNVRKGLLDGERTRIDFTGTVGFNEAVNLDVNLTLSGTAGRRLKSVLSTETIPLKVTGRMDQPRVVPGIDASKLATGALDGLLPGNGKNPLDRLKDLVPR